MKKPPPSAAAPRRRRESIPRRWKILDDPLARGVAITALLLVAMAGSAIAGVMIARYEATVNPAERLAAHAVAQFEFCEPSSADGAVFETAVRSVIEGRAATPGERAERRMAYTEALAWERQRLAMGMVRVNCAQARERIVRLIGF
jgi:hypothetical protein